MDEQRIKIEKDIEQKNYILIYPLMIMLPTKQQTNNALQKPSWDFGNQILYDLCRNNFNHDQDDVIIAKVLFIGRIYAAAVERRRNKQDVINDNFYIDIIAPTFRKSAIDNHLNELRKYKTITLDNIKEILKTHYYLTEILNKITALNKRSFASKYLHFHLPDLFYIYDSRAVEGIRSFVRRTPIYLEKIIKGVECDKEYAKFFCKCFNLKKQVEKQYDIKITNRQLDNMLVEIANDKSVVKNKS